MGAYDAIFGAETKNPSTTTSNVPNTITDELLDSLRVVEGGKEQFPINKTTKAMGPYQFMPDTVQMLHKKGYKFNAFDEQEAREASRKYLTELLDQNKGDLRKALAQYGGFVKTDPTNYVNKVLGNAKQKANISVTDSEPEVDILGQFFSSKENPKPPARMSAESVPTAQNIQPPKLDYSKQQIPSLGEKLVGVGETALKGASSLVAPIVGGAAGIAQNVLGGTLGTQEGLKKAEETAGQVSEALTYEPRTEAGKAFAGNVGNKIQNVLEATKMPPLGPIEIASQLPATMGAANQISGGAKQILRQQLTEKFPQTTPVVKPLPINERIEPILNKPKITYAELQQQLKEKQIEANKPQETLKGVGAARVTNEQERISRAKELPIPIELSKDQATRNPADVRFARETAKDPVLGQALQEKYANDNLKIQKNLDHLVEQTGAEFSGLPEPELAKKLVDTIEPYRKKRRQEVSDAYELADQAGETDQLVSYKPLVDYIEKQTKNRPTKKAQNPILGIVEEEIKANDPTGTGQINLKAMDDIYKTIVNETDPTQRGSLYHSGKLRKAFDEATKGAGGDLYRKARKLNAEYMTEFEDTPVIKNLTAIKKGTTQRTVAIENLIDKSILKGTADDVRRLFTTLEKTPEGQTIANELRGYVAKHIKDEATKGVQLDINGLPYVSTKNLDTVIKGLDKSGKLEYLFGKKNAEYYRTLNDATKDIQTVPQGTTNPSGTAAQIAALLAETGAQFALTGVPAPVVGGLKHGYSYLKTKQQLNKIKDFVNYSKEK